MTPPPKQHGVSVARATSFRVDRCDAGSAITLTHGSRRNGDGLTPLFKGEH